MTDNEGNPHVAVKELRSAEGLTLEDFKKIATNESVVLDRFREQGHSHLIRAIAYYTQGNRHYFIFPWAKGGNLRDFWNSQPSLGAGTTALNFSQQDWAKYLNWFFTQLVGLAQAIQSLHHPPGKSAESCRHGDLKPENILCFGKHEPGATNIPMDVKLLVADAGHAKVHEKATEFRPLGTTTQGGTRMYVAPEAELQPNEARPRRYDIWSLGCLYLEFLIWILYGNEVLERFRRDDVGVNQPFYEKDALKAVVQQWIEAIRDDPRCSPLRPTALRRLVDLIENRLLVVNVRTNRSDSIPTVNSKGSTTISDTSPKAEAPMLLVTRPTMQISSPERADAVELCEEMEKILAAAEKGDSLTWINWDGMEDAAKLGPPQIQDKLAPRRRKSSVGARNKSELFPQVRYHVRPRALQWSFANIP
jgi:serine/threonine protein kinase